MLKAFADIGPHIGLAERQAQQITQALSLADGGITSLTHACERALTPLLSDPQLTPDARQAVAQVLALVGSAVDALQKIAHPFAYETQMVAQQVERMYIGFQYQDRVSQMMALLEQDMAQLQGALANTGGDVPAIDAWLARLESQYAMAEQHLNHAGSTEAGAPSAQGTDKDETTFF
jgi:ABC-type transporter Mla subunit MlaD